MDTKGISKLDLKRRNRRQILLAIRESGMLARVDIAAQLMLTRAAVTIITNQMIAQNILEDMNGPVPEQADAPRKKGRKKTMIRINPTFRYVLGAVVNERSISVGLADLNNTAIDQRYREIGDEIKPEEMISFIVSSCRELMQKHSITGKQMLGLGVGVVPSRWEQFRVEVKDSTPSFAKLCYLLEMELSIPVLAESAIALYGLAGIDYQDPVTSDQLLIYSGAKFHSVIICNQTLVGGFRRDSSSMDRMIVNPNGEKSPGYPDGSAHAELTRQALLAKASAAAKKPMTMKDINEAYDAGDPKITKILDEFLNFLSLIIYNICTSSCVGCCTLQCFRISEKAHSVLSDKVASYAAEGCDPIRVRFSTIDGAEAFRAGSALAIERLFYDVGGMLPGEINA